ncbi:MAG TPA: TonB-dependent receptor [Steroidobacteraceae bacterium]|nr:TonB-dependent receptor [Steroidobacteraceae bacterium]
MKASPLWYAIALLAGSGAWAAEADNAAELAPVTVQATAIPGASLQADLVPGDVQTVSAADISRQGSPSLTGALNRGLGSVNLDDNLDDPFQPDILYRGFEASPVLGTPEGLAVYENGVRINEAFGDAVNWDLIPSMAIDQVSIVSGSPVYGLNALGGGMAVTMKNGFSYQAGNAQLYGGTFNERAGAAEYGAHGDHLGIYVTADALNQDGWREFAEDSLRRLYAVLSARFSRASFDLSYSGARNSLAGQGSAPVQELAISPWLVFTGPQANIDRLNFVTLNGAFVLGDHSALQLVLYDRVFAQTVSNGDNSDYAACTDESALCQSDGLTPLTNAVGQVLPDISDGGTLIIGQNDYERITAYGRGAALQFSSSTRLGEHDNHFSAGASFDDATADFYSGTQIGLLDAALTVLPSDLVVDTPEGSPFGSTPVSLRTLDEYTGLFATDTFSVTRALAATLSARYNTAGIELRDRLGTSLTGDNRYDHFNPALGVTWKLSPVLTAYAGFSENARAPTASEIECANPLQPCLLPSDLASDPPTLRQVVAQTWELGLRGRLAGEATLPGQLSWHAGVFRTSLHDDIYGIATSISSGYFQNIGATRRQGVEAGVHWAAAPWSAHLDYSFVDATFQSALTLPSPSNPYQDQNGDIQVRRGDRLPGVPEHRLKLGAQFAPARFALGADVELLSGAYFFGDESNQNRQLPGYATVDLFGSFKASARLSLFVTIDNLFNRHYATYGIYGDPTGVGAPGVPAGAATNGPGVDNRFESPAAPFSLHGGVRLTL